MTNIPLKRSYAEISQAAWAGLMVGDALGQATEFCHGWQIRRRYPDGVDKMVPGIDETMGRKAAVVTDDTQMAYCLHLALKDAEGWDAAAALRRYREWFDTDPTDVGATIKTALLGKPVGNECQGNGALMRVMPIALWAAEHPGFDWQTAAREDAALTHPSPICGEANVVYVYALLLAMQPGSTPQSIYDACLQFAEEQGCCEIILTTLRNAATEVPDYDGEHIGWVLIALQSAFYQLLHAVDYRSAMLDIVNYGGDADTNAAIAGALLDILYGVGNIPDRWLVCVRAGNEERYTALLPRRRG